MKKNHEEKLKERIQKMLTKSEVILNAGKPKLNYDKYRPKRKSVAERLADKIAKDIHINCDPATFKRHNLGKWQKANGEFVWTMKNKDHTGWVGSAYAATECLKRKYHLEMGIYNNNFTEYEIFPEENKPKEVETP